MKEDELREIERWLDGKMGPVTPTGLIRKLVEHYRAQQQATDAIRGVLARG